MSKCEYQAAGLVAAAGTKVTGYLEVPGTNVKMPMTLVNGAQTGKTVLFTGGTHGGEYPGIEAAIRLAGELNPAQVSGQVIIIHILSPLAFLARQQYYVPLDGKNVNRQFPGNALGTVSERMAHAVFELARQADAWVDMHGGDIHEALVDFSLYSDAAAPDVQATAKAMAEVYGIELIAPRSSVVGGTYGAAAAAGIPAILTESGQVGQLDEQCVQVHLKGCRNVLKLLGVLPGAPDPVGPTKVVGDYLWVRANQTGCWYSAVKPGQLVEEGQVAGVIKDFFGNVLQEYKAPGSGVVLFSVTSLAIVEGDPLLAVGVL